MKRILCMVCIFAMVLSLCNVAVFASETPAYDYLITNGEQFYQYLVTERDTTYGKVFYINGNDTLADGSKGIDLTKADLNPSKSGNQAYSSQSQFYGTIIGVNDANNIQIDKWLFNSPSLTADNVLIENIVLKGNKADGTGTIQSTANAGALFQAVATNYKGTITLKNITNYLDVATTGASSYAGGLIGYTRYRTLTIENCKNYGDITSPIYAGGMVGYAYDNKGTYTNCANYGEVVSQCNAGGIVGRGFSEITLCANYGSINTTATALANTSGTGGIIGYGATGTITSCFNAGNVTSNGTTGGIIGTGATVNVIVTDCFNIGNVSSTSSVEDYNAGGIFGYNKDKSNNTVTNCYNAGVTVYQIGKGRENTVNTACVNNYYISDTDLEQVIGTPITLVNLSKLPAPFNAEPWEKNDDGTYYSLPQIKGNTYYADETDGWYIGGDSGEEPEQPGEDVITVGPASENVLFAKGEDTSFDESLAGEGITGGYAIVAAKFEVPAGVTGYTYGMFISEDSNFTTKKDAVAENNYNGAFGILFWGEMEDGTTYYVRPYVCYNGNYTYGIDTSFVFNAE